MSWSGTKVVSARRSLWASKAGAAGVIALLAVCGTASGQTFTDIAGPELQDALSSGRGAAWGDVDNDGDQDIMWVNFEGVARIFRQGPLGSFTEVLDPDVNVTQEGGQPIFGDYDNDGRLDLYMVNSGTGSFLLHNEGGFNFSTVSNGTNLQLDSVLARGASWADYDSDGWLDVYISSNGQQNPEEEDKLFNNQGNGTFVDLASGSMLSFSVGRGVAWADFDNDGDQDLFATNGLGCPCEATDPNAAEASTFSNRLYRNNGNGSFTDLSSNLTASLESARGICTGDYDNDGDFDVYITNIRINGLGGNNKLLRNDGNFVFTDVTTTQLADRGDHRSCAFVEVDNDGDLDLHFMALSGRTSKLFRNNGNGTFTSITAGPLTTTGNGRAAAWADYDRDGDMDVFMTYEGPNKMVRNDLTGTNKWLVVELVGSVSNRTAIGARVSVTTNLPTPKTQIREIQSGTGYLSQHMLAAHFGLGAATTVDTLTVRWPSGTVQTLHDVAVNRYLSITEPLCAADFNHDGAADSQDFFDFLDAFFAGEADFNGDLSVDSQDFFDFLDVFFPGC